jgi:hypothetical protein
MSVHGNQVVGPHGKYAPGRDFANIGPDMVLCATQAIQRDYWPEFYAICERSFFEATGGSPEDFFAEVEKGIVTYCAYLEACCENPEENVDDVLARVGWREVAAEARLLWAGMLGSVVTGQLFAGLRDITPLGGPKPEELRQALHSIREAARRGFNGLSSTEDGVKKLKTTIKDCREAGLSYAEIEAILVDVKLGRA